VREDVCCAFKAFYCLDLRLGLKDLFMHKKHSLHALNIKVTILSNWIISQRLNENEKLNITVTSIISIENIGGARIKQIEIFCAKLAW
jgi:hypothetical protein